MAISGTTALVTGANRGIGRHFATELLERGAAKVYAAAREPGSIDVPGVVPVRLDLTDEASITAAAELAGDVDLLVNNAGITGGGRLLDGDPGAIRAVMETNFFGTLAVTRAFAPILAAGGGGTILNVLSRLAWQAYPGSGAYGASKAAGWSLTDNLRLELAEQGTRVAGLYLSATDTDMTAGWDIPKNDPADVVRRALDGLESGALEIIADEDTATSKRGLSLDPAVTYAELLGAAVPAAG